MSWFKQAQNTVISPSQKSVTDSPEFMAWFSGSKAVDSTGRPMVFYHGTKNAFDTFEVGTRGSNSNFLGSWDVQRAAIFFTPDPNLAAGFASQGEETGFVGENIKPVYLAVFDPIDLRNGFTFAELNTMEDLGLNPRYYNNVQHMWEIFDYENGGQELVSVLKKMGHDGAIMSEEGSDTWAVFDPIQIKSVGNKGRFDKDSPNILASRAISA